MTVSLLLQDLLSGMLPDAAKAALPALAVYYITQRNIGRHKAQSDMARDEAKKEIASSLAPALQLFKAEFTDEVLRRMNGTYLRSEEARVHFANLVDSIKRLEKSQENITDTVTSMALVVGRRKTD